MCVGEVLLARFVRVWGTASKNVLTLLQKRSSSCAKKILSWRNNRRERFWDKKKNGERLPSWTRNTERKLLPYTKASLLQDCLHQRRFVENRSMPWMCLWTFPPQRTQQLRGSWTASGSVPRPFALNVIDMYFPTWCGRKTDLHTGDASTAEFGSRSMT